MSEQSRFEDFGWTVHDWHHAGQQVTVLQREEFRMQWFATKLVTYAFLIHRTPEDYSSLLDDYAAMRECAIERKETWLPLGFQCGYALLPIYLGQGFSSELVADVRHNFRKRWCVLHIPSLFDVETGRLETLEAGSFWGCVYRPYIHETITDVANLLPGAMAVA